MNTATLLGNRIDIWQREHGYTNADVAELIGCNKGTVCFWRSGQGLPTLLKLQTLRELGVNLNDIEGVPSFRINANWIKKFLIRNQISASKLNKELGLSYGTVNKLAHGKDSYNFDSMLKLDKFMQEYDGRVNEWKQTETSPAGNEDTPSMDNIFVENDVQETPNILDIIERMPDTEPVQEVAEEEPEPTTLRSLIDFATKHNALDSVITISASKVTRFKLVVEDDGSSRICLRV